MVPQNNCNSSKSQITITNTVIMRKFEIRKELLRCDTETCKWANVFRKTAPTDLVQGCHKPSICLKKKTKHYLQSSIKGNNKIKACLYYENDDKPAGFAKIRLNILNTLIQNKQLIRRVKIWQIITSLTIQGFYYKYETFWAYNIIYGTIKGKQQAFLKEMEELTLFADWYFSNNLFILT